jgi:transketolase
MAIVAAGLALGGKMPFITSYAMFSPGRNWEQIRTTICYNDVNVKIIGSHAGISVGPDGATHQAVEDMGIMRALPNMRVIAPADWIEARKATLAIADVKGPCYIRLSREKVPTITTENTPFSIGKAEIYRDGSDVAIVACGQLVYEALLAAEQLAKEGVDAMVINNHTIKPLDKSAMIAAARHCGAIVTAEEHQVNTGLGGAVAEVVSQDYPVPMKIIGIQDRFGESGDPSVLLDAFGLRARDIIDSVRKVMSMKGRR